MAIAARIVFAMALGLSLGACSTLDKLTRQTDDTVLPGPREDAIPGRTQYPAPGEQPTKTAGPDTAAPAPPADTPVEEKKPCAADDPDCLPPLTDDDTFSDGQ